MRLIHRASGFSKNTAIISERQVFTYQQLLEASEKMAQCLLDGREDLMEARVAMMVKPGFDYVRVQWGIWRAGGIAVPLHPGSPLPAVQYILEDCDVDTLVLYPEFETEYQEYISTTNIRLAFTHLQPKSESSLPDISSDRRAMILYTSGTTGSPKGVVTTHQNIEAQIQSLVEAWEWSASDHILNILPMHHVHGIINVLSCALWSGATCQFVSRFNPEEVCNVFTQRDLTLFMAVPTIYHKLISYWESLESTKQREISNGLKELRLMVSGSAALPVSVMLKWEEISGHTLLERYGMTEIGMAISNSYHGERRPGHIGQPLPGVQVKLANESGQPVREGAQGEILVKGPNVFKEYWRRPEATRESFTDDNWFKTGDIAICISDVYKIIGRSSVDIIKSGGYKLSALEIEEVLRTLDGVKDCGVVGIVDPEWGELVCAALVLENQEAGLDIDQINHSLRANLAAYKVPRKYIILEDLPRNAMGKVTKSELKKLF